MDITKPNDIFVATLNNPGATTSDLMTLDLTPDNTGLLSKDDYKQSKYVKDKFTLENGNFDEPAFDAYYKQALTHYNQMTDDSYLKGLNEIEYSPFDLTRPKDSKTFNVNIEFSKDYNPFKQLYGRSSIYSIDDNDLSLRELAQQSKVFDTKTGEWSDKSANDLGLLQKFFGDTLVYAQWDEDGIHTDAETGRVVNHKKGDWKTNDSGNFYLETLGDREVYGKQVVNPMDMLTTDGSFANQFDFMDSDSKTKSITGTAFKTAAEIAPFLIPGVNTVYGGVRAAIGLASVLPTFYKSFEGMLLGDEQTPLNKTMTQIEGYMAKFNQNSVSDEGQKSMMSFEQLAEMVGSTFGQIYEQRAMASLSNIFYSGAKQEALMMEKYEDVLKTVQKEAFEDLGKSKLSADDFMKINKLAIGKVPELQDLYKKQSDMAKALNLGYMALTSTADIYGDALQGGYDRRTAGFAAIMSAAGQYGIMTNNRMGDWFLDKTTGYTKESNRAMMRKAVDPWLKEIEDTFQTKTTDQVKKSTLSGIYSKFKSGLEDMFLSPSVLGENLWKNALVEGVEEVTEQAVQDATKGIIDTMSYLGLTKKQGSFGGFDTVFSKEGLQNYMANFVGGVLGGAMFEFNDSHLSKLLNPNNNAIQPDTKKSLYQLVADGHENEIINYLEKNRRKLGNNFMSPVLDADGNALTTEDGKTQADLITDSAIRMVKQISTILDANNLKHSENDIIKRAILDDTIIKDLEKHRVEGKQVGIEGLILDDYRNLLVKIGDLSNQVKNAEGEGKETKFLKQELKTYTEQINDILEGKNSGIYFDKMMVLLNKDMFSDFLTMDKQSYSKNTYNIDYNELPQDGLGLSKTRIDKEWSDMIEGKDLVKNLNSVTNAYLNWEQLLNKPLSEYSESGYSQERAEVYKNVLNLKETLNQFNTSGSPEERKSAIDKFVEINNYFKKLGEKTIAPWDVYHTNLAEDIIKEGLVKKVEYVKDKNGIYQPSESDYSIEELNSPLLRENINQVMNNFPIDPFDFDLGISNFNSLVQNDANSRILQLQALENNPERTEEQNLQLKELSGLTFPKLLDSTNSSYVQELKRNHNEDLINLFQEFANKNNESHDDILSDYSELLNNYQNAVNNDKIDEILNPVDENTDRLNLLNKLIESGELVKTLNNLKSSISEEDYNDLLNEINELSSLDNDELTNKVNQLFAEKSDLINSAIENYNKDYNLKNNDDIKELFNNFNNLNTALEKNISENKPEFFKLKNYAFEFLLNKLENGLADNEIFEETKKLYSEEKQRIFETVFKNKTIDFQLINDLLSYKPELLDNLNELYEMVQDDLVDGLEDADFEIPESIKNYLLNSESMRSWTSQIKILSSQLNNYSKELELINRFETLSNSVQLKKNPLYDFIRSFSLTLNSNSKISKIMDILENEERNLNQASSINNFISDNIREKDINQALNVLKIIKTVINAMSTTQVSYGDPYGFIYTRQEFAKRNGVDSEIKNLKTLTSDIANLTSNDVDRLINKLDFYKQLAENNSGRMIVEQETIRSAMNEIFVDRWMKIRKSLPVSFLPHDKFDEIVNSKLETNQKLLKIEDLFYDTNKGKEKEVLSELINNIFSDIDLSKSSKITRDVLDKDVVDIDVLNYITSTLIVKGSDWAKLNYKSLENFEKAPFYNQELASRIIRASTINPELYSQIINKYKSGDNEPADFITFVLGGAGTGKTTAVFGLNIDQFRLSNDHTILNITAPTDLQTNNLNKSISESVGEDKLNIIKTSKDSLFEKLGVSKLVNQINSELNSVNNSLIKDALISSWENNSVDSNKNQYIYNNNGSIGVYIPNSELQNLSLENLPNLLLIDEITHFNFAEIHLLNEISKISYNKEGSNFMKVIAAGDPNQLGYFISQEGSFYQYNVNAVDGIKTPILNTTVRAVNNQKRANNDFLVGLIDKISLNYDTAKDRDTANKLSQEFINSNNFILDYFQDEDKLNGELITPELLKSQVLTIANAIKNNSNRTLGILSIDGKIPSNIQSILDNINIPEENIKTFNPNNIQGSEVDYFIFDANLISKYDTLRDQLKSFYTYASRAKRGSIIIDSDIQEGQGYLERNLRITNNKKSLDTQEFEALSDSVIQKAKDDRKKDLEKLLNGDFELSQDTYFTWRTGKLERGKQSDLGDYFPLNEETPSPIAEQIKTHIEEAKEDNKQKYSKDEFKLILYSFYKNANANINEFDDKIIITKSNESLKSDLGVNTIGFSVDKDKFNKIEKQWLDLRNELFNSLAIGGKRNFTLSSDQFEQFLGYAFQSDLLFENTKNLNCKYVVTASKYNEDSNHAYNKSLDDTSRHLKDGDLFLTISAELEIGNNKHYITLAAFPSRETLMSKALNNVTDTDRASLEKSLTEVLNNLEKDIQNGPKVVDLNSKLSLLTGVRLLREDVKSDKVKKYPEIKLSELSTKFKDATFEQIKLYPSDYNEFKKLIINNYFNYVGKSDSELEKDLKIQELFEKLKNKPYIRITFGNYGDSDLGKILPVYSKSRNIDTITKEVEQHLKSIKDIISAKSTNKEKLSKDDFAKANLIGDMMLNKSNVLDILINWGLTKETDSDKSLLDIFTQKFTPKVDILGTGGFTMLDIITRFQNQNESGKTSKVERLENAVDIVKEFIKKHPNLDKKQIKSGLLNTSNGVANNFTGTWAEGFYNLFAYKNILKNQSNLNFEKVALLYYGKQNGNIDSSKFEDFITDNSLFDELSKTADILISNIDKNQKLYYNIPIVSDNGIKVNEGISGKTGFNDAIFDNFYINTYVESPNLLIPWNVLTSLQSNTKPIENQVIETQKEETPIEEDYSEFIPNIITFDKLENIINKIEEDTDNDDDFTTQKLYLNSYLEIMKLFNSILVNNKNNIKQIFRIDENSTQSDIVLYELSQHNYSLEQSLSSKLENLSKDEYTYGNLVEIFKFYSDLFPKSIDKPRGTSSNFYINLFENLGTTERDVMNNLAKLTDQKTVLKTKSAIVTLFSEIC